MSTFFEPTVDAESLVASVQMTVAPFRAATLRLIPGESGLVENLVTAETSVSIADDNDFLVVVFVEAVVVIHSIVDWPSFCVVEIGVLYGFRPSPRNDDAVEVLINS